MTEARDVIAVAIFDLLSIERGELPSARADDILTALRAAGFAVVPMEPTEAMVESAYATLSLAANPQMWPSSHSAWNAMWIKTMLQHALKAAQGGSDE